MLKIKVFGERNSGTNFLQGLIRDNFDHPILPGQLNEPEVSRFMRMCVRYAVNDPGRDWVRDVYFRFTSKSNLGWKHAMAPTGQDLAGRAEHIVFVTVTKNPYSWLLSLYKRPYHAKEELGSFREFLSKRWLCVGRERYEPRAFATPMDIWCAKNDSYRRLKELAPKVINLRYEDLLANPETVLTAIGTSFGLKRRTTAWAIKQESTKNEETSFSEYKDYYLRERWRAKLDNEDVEIINRHLDRPLVESYGYEILRPGDA